MKKFVLLLTALSAGLHAQIPGMDLAVAEKWSKAKTIRYHVEAVHQGRVSLATSTLADVADRVTLDFDWDSRGKKPIGEIKFVNAKSQVTKPGADGTKCPPPAIKGPYEHLEVTKISVQPGGAIELKGTRTIPSVDDPQWPATCSPRATAARSEEVTEFFGLAEPQILGMPTNAGPKSLKIAADRKSYALTNSTGWTWTITPTLVQ